MAIIDPIFKYFITVVRSAGRGWKGQDRESVTISCWLFFLSGGQERAFLGVGIIKCNILFLFCGFQKILYS